VSLEAGVEAELGSLRLSVCLDVGDGEAMAIVGPNGAGKTTLLRCIAGLCPLLAGRVVVDDEVLDDAVIGLAVPPEARPVGFVFQDYLLFAHLSVVDNVAFGLRCRGEARRTSRAEAGRWLERVGLEDVADSRVSELSGGQRQRVALARALATRPRVLLLDEPLAAVDLAARTELRRNLRAALDDFEGTGLLVTHDPLDAYALADRILVLEEGSVVQQGSVAEVTSRPRTRWVAEMIGVNLYRGKANRGRISLAPSGSLEVPTSLDGDVFALVSPRAVAVHRSPPEGSARNVWAGTASSLDLEGDRVRVEVTGSPSIVAEVTPASVADLRLADGGVVWVSIKATDIDLYPA
jgi:molybdate transport system ATP-binding protein